MLIVTPNPAIDHTVRLSELRPGQVIRTGLGVSVAGGKGGNVARAAACLSTPSTVLAFVPETGSAHLRDLYAAEGLALVPVPVGGRVRTCTALIEAGGRVTLLNEPGAPLSDEDWGRLMTALAGQVASTRPGVIICSGSMPPGAPEDGYAQVVSRARETGCEAIVDASGAPLAAAVGAGADLVCPNLAEAETLAAVGMRERAAELVDDAGDDVPERAQHAAAALLERGARWAVVTAGAAGAAVAGPDHTAWYRAPEVTVRNPIGAGDSFLAGVATARLAGLPWPRAIRRGLAAGSASVEQDRAGVVDGARVDELERMLGTSEAS